MNARRLIDMGGHCIRRGWPAVVLLVCPAIWGQESPSAVTSTAKTAASAPSTTKTAVKPASASAALTASAAKPRVNLYLGHAEELLSDSQWQNLLVRQHPEDTEPPSDSRDWGDSATREVKVQAEKPAPEVPGGIGGLFWAIRHPVQAWRVLVPSSQ